MILERDTNIQSKPNAYAYFQNKDDDKRKEEDRELEDENNKERKKTLVEIKKNQIGRHFIFKNENIENSFKILSSTS